jgi:hypothetical protein
MVDTRGPPKLFTIGVEVSPRKQIFLSTVRISMKIYWIGPRSEYSPDTRVLYIMAKQFYYIQSNNTQSRYWTEFDSENKLLKSSVHHINVHSVPKHLMGPPNLVHHKILSTVWASTITIVNHTQNIGVHRNEFLNQKFLYNIARNVVYCKNKLQLKLNYWYRAHGTSCQLIFQLCRLWLQCSREINFDPQVQHSAVQKLIWPSIVQNFVFN